MNRDEYRALFTQARHADLHDVMATLGGEPDRYDRRKFRVDGRHISINGEQFYDHDAGCGGGGAIDLVMHVRQCDFNDAVAYLTGHVPVPLRSADHERRREGPTSADERRPFVPPRRDVRSWPQVRTYLTEERGIPARIVDNLHRAGIVYADGRQNAVFLRHAPDGIVTGASVRGTRDGTDFKGLAAGTNRDAGYFYYHTGERQPYTTPSLVLAEAPIDALSVHALRLLAEERGPVTLLSTDGAGALPTAMIDKALAHGWTVQAAFDADKGGDLLWRRLGEHYPRETARETIWREAPPHGKDWNDTLRYVLQERAQALDREVHGR